MESESSDGYLAMSDMFSGLMMVFMLIAIVFMQRQQEETARHQENTAAIQQLIDRSNHQRSSIYEQLRHEFRNDLNHWGATIDSDTLTIRFENPQIFFETGSSVVNDEFKNVLDDFWPRYLSVVKENQELITTIALNGHTSTIWNANTSVSDAYFHNMELSQSRTRNVLQYCENISPPEERAMIRDIVTANGLSSSRRIYDRQGSEDVDASRRVEFVINRRGIQSSIDNIIRTLGE